MKTPFLIIGLLAVFCGCASAEPPDHKAAATNAVMTIVAPAGVPIDGVIGYGAMHADSQWTRIKFMQCTNAQYMTANVPRYDLYTATSTNSATGQESDYAPKVALDTNGVLVVPAVQVK